MPSTTAADSKDDWRMQFRSYRQTLSADAYATLSARICCHTLALPAVGDAAVVHTYWPVPEKGEIDTRPLIRALHEQEREVVLPVVTSYDPALPSMEHRRYTGPSEMTTNRWGIREPVDTQRVAPDRFDVVIIPALGADRRGHRIGYGSGYYDAFLQEIDVPRVVLTYDACLVPAIPAEPHDVPGTVVVTENGVTTPDP